MPKNAFSRISLVIDVTEESYEANTLVLRQPSKYHPKRSRIIMHETLHWWQQLGHGFMSLLANEEWQRLKSFEENGRFVKSGPFMKEFARKNINLGFSALTLQESLTRFWDMHICGPLDLLDFERERVRFTDEAFWQRYDDLRLGNGLTGPDGTGYSDLAYALTMEGAGGRYAVPYKMAVDKTSTKVAGIVFPIAAHFAMQTTKPTDYYAKFLDLLSPSAEALPPGPIEDLWVNFYFTARTIIFPVIMQANERPLMPIVEIRETGLNEHPGYARALFYLESYAPLLKDSNVGQFIAQQKSGLEDHQIGLLALDVFLATPGIPDHRGGLYQLFAPPVVRFSDNKTWLLGYEHRKELYPDASDEERGLTEWQKAAEEAIAMDERWNKHLQAKYL